MKALIVDDSDYKIRDLEALLKQCAFVTEYKVAKSFHGGVRCLKEFKPDLVLLDMSLPTNERPDGDFEGRDRIYGGKDILAEMEFHKLTGRVIIVTQFDHFGDPPHSIDLDTLLGQLEARFPKLYAGGVYYSNVDSQWRVKLLSLLQSTHGKRT